MSWSFNFNSLREKLRKAYNEPGSHGSFFISGQEFLISTKQYYYCTMQSYLRCSAHKDELINDVKSYLKDKRLLCHADRDATFFGEGILKFSGQSHYAFCKQDRCDFNIYTANDHSTDFYVALSFYVDRKCSLEVFDIFVGFICDVLTKVFQWCSFGCCTCDSIKLTNSCDFVFVMQRFVIPNDVIKIVASYC